jgi:hypothetical protein
VDAGQQKIADDQKTLPTRLDRPLELQISQDMQLEDGWRVHDDDHKLNGWNVLGPDLPVGYEQTFVRYNVLVVVNKTSLPKIQNTPVQEA